MAEPVHHVETPAKVEIQAKAVVGMKALPRTHNLEAVALAAKVKEVAVKAPSWIRTAKSSSINKKECQGIFASFIQNLGGVDSAKLAGFSTLANPRIVRCASFSSNLDGADGLSPAGMHIRCRMGKSLHLGRFRHRARFADISAPQGGAKWAARASICMMVNLDG